MLVASRPSRRTDSTADSRPALPQSAPGARAVTASLASPAWRAVKRTVSLARAGLGSAAAAASAATVSDRITPVKVAAAGWAECRDAHQPRRLLPAARVAGRPREAPLPAPPARSRPRPLADRPGVPARRAGRRRADGRARPGTRGAGHRHRRRDAPRELLEL